MMIDRQLKPSYAMTVPSTKQKIRFRPFVVREEKVLLMAQESGKDDELLQAMRDTVAACISPPDAVDIMNSPKFDVEFLFLNIRAKSVKEIANPAIQCKECQEPVTVTAELEKAVVVFPDASKDRTIRVDDRTAVVFRYPGVGDLANIKGKADFDGMLTMMAGCVESITVGDKVSLKKDVTQEEVKDFFEGMTSPEFSKLVGFFTEQPYVCLNVQVDCPKCKASYSVEVRDSNSFFRSASRT